MGRSMGIGALGGSKLIIKKKHRWTFTVSDFCSGGVIPESFVQVAARPSLTIEETELNFLNAKRYVPGKATWETISVSYVDVATQDNLPLFDWIATLYDFTDPVNLHQASQSADYAGIGALQMYSGCGDPLELWTLGDIWPQSINFGELDYTSTDNCMIELTLRFSQVTYKSLCPSRQPQACCSPCTGTSS